MSLRIKILILAAMALISCNENLVPSDTVDVGKVSLLFKHENGTVVGEEMLVLVTSEVNKNIPMTLLMTSGLGIRKYDIYSKVKLVIPGDHLTESGKYTFSVLHAGELKAEENVTISAGEIANPLDLYTGPRSILVGQKQKTMITTIPSDKYDNGITEKTSILVSTDRSQKDNQAVQINNLLAVYELTSDNKAKIINAGVSKDEKSAKAQTIIQEADWATDFTIQVVDKYPYADNNHYTKIRTNKLFDKHGNQVANGTLLTFAITDDEGNQSSYNGIVIDGYGNVNLRNPNIPTTLKVVAHIGPFSSSNLLALTYSSIIKRIPFRFNSNSDLLEIGPIVAHEGQFIPDGTLAELRIKDELFTTEVIDGECNFNLNELNNSKLNTLHLSISGLEQKIVIK